MRKYLIVLAVALGPALLMPPHAAAATKPTEQEMLVVKKKKAEQARKAEARKLQEKRKVDAARKARQLVLQKATAEARRKAPERRVSARRNCGGFLNCLFGSSPRNGVQRASFGGTGNDFATASIVDWNDGKHAPGSIVVRTPERALYLVLGDGQARRYKVGVGREGFQWSGTSRIVNKAEWPTWRPPQVMIEREAAKGHMLPDVMEGGPENPLGARAMYIGGTMFRIHGTNNAASIGGAVSSGCIRMMNTDVVDLYDRVKIGARVYVYQ